MEFLDKNGGILSSKYDKTLKDLIDHIWSYFWTEFQAEKKVILILLYKITTNHHNEIVRIV